MSGRHVFIWGTGSSASKLIEKYNIRIDSNTFFVDGSTDKQGGRFMGKKILSPKNIKLYDDSYVVIASSYYEEIIEEIQEEHICKIDNVVNMNDFKNYWIE